MCPDADATGHYSKNNPYVPAGAASEAKRLANRSKVNVVFVPEKIPDHAAHRGQELDGVLADEGVAPAATEPAFPRESLRGSHGLKPEVGGDINDDILDEVKRKGRHGDELRRLLRGADDLGLKDKKLAEKLNAIATLVDRMLEGIRDSFLSANCRSRNPAGC